MYKYTYEKAAISAAEKKYPQKFYVQKKVVSTKPFELLQQALQFANGTIIVGYDVWRCLDRNDCSSDPNSRWYNSIDNLQKFYEIRPAY